MTAVTTLGAVLHDGAEQLRGAGIDDADLEADVLLRHALGMDDDRAHLFARLHEPVGDGHVAHFDALLRRRIAREPAAYIVGFREFYGLKLECMPAALIPRPETELLVEIGLDWLARLEPPSAPLIFDVGTGNGALAVALAVGWPRARIVAFDTSIAALNLARRNAARHNVETRVSFVAADLLDPVATAAELVVANLPYVGDGDWPNLAPEIRRHEPRAALVGGPDGTETIARLLRQVRPRLRARALLLCECGDRQGATLRGEAARWFPDARIEIRKDLAGLDRVLYVER
jgi:release factor glutamine methyltransferase